MCAGSATTAARVYPPRLASQRACQTTKASPLCIYRHLSTGKAPSILRPAQASPRKRVGVPMAQRKLSRPLAHEATGVRTYLSAQSKREIAWGMKLVPFSVLCKRCSFISHTRKSEGLLKGATHKPGCVDRRGVDPTMQPLIGHGWTPQLTTPHKQGATRGEDIAETRSTCFGVHCAAGGAGVLPRRGAN